MGCLGNILWFIFGGFLSAIGWFLVGCVWCITIVGIPIGLQCFKIAGLSLWPFGKEVVPSNRTGSLILNILWLIFGGLELALNHLLWSLLLSITIIGIPFGQQHFKLAKLALVPFGAEII
ncbi:YccF domain-containing protein [Schleiferilactobacillus harbinensis]|uniref:YccF domain-containing protein n=1 Tax=Schleiferilactobacillus harbinensis TaxID=304207 RepID=A0A5P8M7M7_9LACO|nr:YccF domain-containing protein [Schleiferilactobacillus harbinensis]QFR24528.1 YccF domain-containing protein [Schleiferilactobacillus harbinensis]